jgi:hypothetical protein
MMIDYRYQPIHTKLGNNLGNMTHKQDNSSTSKLGAEDEGIQPEDTPQQSRCHIQRSMYKSTKVK